MHLSSWSSCCVVSIFLRPSSIWSQQPLLVSTCIEGRALVAGTYSMVLKTRTLVHARRNTLHLEVLRTARGYTHLTCAAPPCTRRIVPVFSEYPPPPPPSRHACVTKKACPHPFSVPRPSCGCETEIWGESMDTSCRDPCVHGGGARSKLPTLQGEQHVPVSIVTSEGEVDEFCSSTLTFQQN